MLTIVFYATNGAAAKARARAIAADTKGHYARCYDVASWENTEDKCDFVEIMPDVPGWQRDRILKVFGPVVPATEVPVAEADEQTSAVEIEQPYLKPMGNFPEKEQKTAKHRGGGRWFVMAGEEIISGPHDKEEAMRLSKTDEAEAST